MNPRRLGVMGGTFDPIHCGHVDAAAAAQSALGLTGVLIVTSNVPPHRPLPFASAYHRFAMAALAVAGHPGWQASDIELQGNSRSFTSSTLQKLHERGYAPNELFFIIGADAFAEIATWVDYPVILDYAHFAVVSRPHFPVASLADRLPALASRMSQHLAEAAELRRRTSLILIDSPTSDVSSTAIRDRRARGESIRGLVPENVRQHIEQHELYSSSAPEPRAHERAGAQAAGRLHGQD